MLSDVDLPVLAKSPTLPADVVRCVAEQVCDDSVTLASLCLLDTRCFDLVLPLLYNTVRLRTPGTIECFCSMVTRAERNLGGYVYSLYIEPPDPSSEHLNHLATPIHLALQRTPNLTTLVLHVDTPSTISLYHALHIHPPPFSLKLLSCYSTTPTHLIAFLVSQPALTHLTLHDPRLALRPGGIRSILSTCVPNLVSIRANPLTIHAFVPGRPVTHVDSGSMVIFNATSYLFCEALRGSSAPEGVQDVSVCIPKTKFWTGASDFITRLGAVCGTSLRNLNLRMPDLRVWALDLGSYAVLIEVLVASLGGFCHLQCFRFDGERASIPPVIVMEDLGDVGTLKFWKKQCPSLERVVLFGTDLP
ncbi:hypothetical protein RhiJN_00464 [Ceratobasidium sp. AG-Ba]|nr:hypothetical protein RhiJN_00464 [Ceratobasidium sp. AG-Ba]